MQMHILKKSAELLLLYHFRQFFHKGTRILPIYTPSIYSHKKGKIYHLFCNFFYFFCILRSNAG